MRLITENFAFLDAGLKAESSDWQLCANEPVVLRVQGRLVFKEPLPAEEFARFLLAAAPPDAVNHAEGRYHYDGSFSHGEHRFRINIFDAFEGRRATVRHLPPKFRTLRDLDIPPKFQDIINGPRGLVIVTGPTGSGKSSTLASAINHINENDITGNVIISFEDPIEYRHTNKKSLVIQREMGAAFLSFAEALKASLRQDPDILMVGEMRDFATMSAAMTAAETGHLVFATMHTSSAAGTLSRIVDATPGNDAAQTRSQLAKSLRGVLAQQLVRTIDGRRCAAFELLINTPAVENCIREGLFNNIADEISRGSNHGMIAMDSSLESLVRRRRTTKDEALRCAFNRKFLENRLTQVSA